MIAVSTTPPTRVLELPLSFFERGAKVATLGVTVKNVPGALSSVLVSLAERGLNILGLVSSCARTTSMVVTNTLIVDYSVLDSVMTLHLVVDELKKNPYVIDAKLSLPDVEGFVVDNYHGSYSLLSQRCVVLIAPVVKEIVKWLVRLFKEDGAAILLYNAGISIGRMMAETHVMLGFGFEDSMLVMRSQLKAMGVASDAVIDRSPDGREYNITIEQSFECEALAGTLKPPTSHFIRGLFSEFFKVHTGTLYSVSEVACINLGDKWCLFSARPHQPR